MAMTFGQRRRVVLTGFAMTSTLFFTAAAIWWEDVVRGFVWLCSDSLGAAFVLVFVSSVLTLRAKRRLTYAAMRRPPAGEATRSALGGPGHLGPRFLLFAAMVVIGFLILTRFS
jgi:hypothetical protein